eukprot:scaffold6976_cov118-Isochrysis_galbana.AAC.3
MGDHRAPPALPALFSPGPVAVDRWKMDGGRMQRVPPARHHYVFWFGTAFIIRDAPCARSRFPVGIAAGAFGLVAAAGAAAFTAVALGPLDALALAPRSRARIVVGVARRVRVRPLARGAEGALPRLGPLEAVPARRRGLRAGAPLHAPRPRARRGPSRHHLPVVPARARARARPPARRPSRRRERRREPVAPPILTREGRGPEGEAVRQETQPQLLLAT